VVKGKTESGKNSRNSSIVELNTSNSSSQNISNAANKRSIYKSFGSEKDPFSEKDISVIKPNK